MSLSPFERALNAAAAYNLARLRGDERLAKASVEQYRAARREQRSSTAYSDREGRALCRRMAGFVSESIADRP